MNAFRPAFEKLSANKDVKDADGLRHKRFIVYIDRGVRFENPKRKKEIEKDAQDEIFMFQPPDDVHNIPRDAVPEWGFNASRTCIIPIIKAEHIHLATSVNESFR